MIHDPGPIIHDPNAGMPGDAESLSALHDAAIFIALGLAVGAVVVAGTVGPVVSLRADEWACAARQEAWVAGGDLGDAYRHRVYDCVLWRRK